MKKLIFGFIALLMVSGNAFAYQDDGNASTKREIAGAPAWIGYREYMLVRYANNLDAGSNTPLSAGDVVVWSCVSDDGVTVDLVSTASSSDAVAGVVVSTTIPSCETVGTTAQTDYGRRNWGYIQVRGLSSNVNLVGGGVTIAGQPLKASGTARNADASVNSGVGVVVRTLGVALDTGNDPDVWIDL